MISTGIYVRVSTEEQAKEGYSIRAQEEKLRSYATLKEWLVYGIYADEGRSGKDIDGRPEMKRLIADIESGKVENVLVFKIDRLTRSTKNLIELMELFNRRNCAFSSLNEAIDTSSATGRMFLKIVGIFAEFERENLAERVRLGFERKAKEGYTLATYRQSYGYEREKGAKTLQVNPAEAEVVRRVFDMYLNDDYTFYKIAKTLNAQKVPTKMGRRWSVVTVKDILKNPTYMGKIRYSCRDSSRYFEADGYHEPIVDERVFFEVQDKIGRIKRVARSKRPTEGVYFCGVLYCPVCGCKYSPKWDYRTRHGGNGEPAYPTYRCHNSLKDMGCNAKSMSHVKLEQAFEEYITRIADLRANDIEQPAAAPDCSAEMAAINVEIGQIERRTKEVMELFMSGDLDFSEYQSMAKIGNERRKVLETRLEQLEKTREHQRVRYNKKEIIANVRENWQVMSDKERQQFVQKFVKKIVAHGETPKSGRFNEVIIDEVVFNEF